MCSRRGCSAEPVFRIGERADLSGDGACPQHLVELVAAQLAHDSMSVVVVSDRDDRVAEIAAAAA